MSKILDYYKGYYANGGVYKLGDMGLNDRVLNFLDWITLHCKPGDKILDIGCGDSTFAKILPQFKWTGIDINTEKAQAPAVSWNLEQSPYPFVTGEFDAVVCSEVLEHLWDMRVVHHEAKRLLRPGGFYFISTPNHAWIDNWLEGYVRILYNPEQPWTMEHIRHYNLAVHNKHLTEAGFTCLDHTGADAAFSQFLQEARHVLKHVLVDGLGHKEFTEGKVDQIIGKMFSQVSHTICIASQKGV